MVIFMSFQNSVSFLKNLERPYTNPAKRAIYAILLNTEPIVESQNLNRIRQSDKSFPLYPWDFCQSLPKPLVKLAGIK